MTKQQLTGVEVIKSILGESAATSIEEYLKIVEEYRNFSSSYVFSGIGVDNNLENIHKDVLEQMLDPFSPTNDILFDDSADVVEFLATRQIRELTVKYSFEKIEEFFNIISRLGLSKAISSDTQRVFIGTKESLAILVGNKFGEENEKYGDFFVHVTKDKDEFYGLKELMNNLIEEGAIKSSDIVALEELKGYDFGYPINDLVDSRDVLNAIQHLITTERAMNYLRDQSDYNYRLLINSGASCDFLTLSIRYFPSIEDISSVSESELLELSEKSNLVFDNIAEENFGGAGQIFYPFGAAYKKL